MMVEGGQAEGGDVQTKDMRTEINGGNASDPQNFELKHVLQNPEGGNLSSAEAGRLRSSRGRSGVASWTSCSPWWDTPSGSATSGGSPTSATSMEVGAMYNVM